MRLRAGRTRAHAANRSLRARAVTNQERTAALIASHDLMINMGRPAEAGRLAAELLGSASDDVTALSRIVAAALIDAGDTVVAARAAGYLDRLATRSDLPRQQRVSAACAAGQWRAWRGDDHEAVLSVLATGSAERTTLGLTSGVCASLIRGLNALRTGEGVPDALAELESLCRDGPDIDFVTLKVANRVSALLHEATGDRAGAYTAIRRDVFMPAGEVLLSSRRREMGRLAELAGDRDAPSKRTLSICGSAPSPNQPRPGAIPTSAPH